VGAGGLGRVMWIHCRIVDAPEFWLKPLFDRVVNGAVMSVAELRDPGVLLVKPSPVLHQPPNVEVAVFGLYLRMVALWTRLLFPGIERLDTGKLAITIEGVDGASSENHDKITKKLLTDQNR